MDISSENDIIMADIAADGGSAMDDIDVQHLSREYTLNILNEKNGETISLNFLGTTSILDVKTHVYTITNIAVRHQIWVGWPPDIRNEMLLGMIGISVNCNLTLKSNDHATRPTSGHRAGSSSARASSGTDGEPIEIDSDSSVDEFEDASDFNGDDDIFTTPAIDHRHKYLSKY